MTMRKVVVLPHEVYESMQKDPKPQALKDPKKQKLINIENELQTILNNKNIEIHEKKDLYQHWLQKLVEILSTHSSTPLPSPPIHAKNDDNVIEGGIEDNILSMLEKALPPSIRSKGLALYDAFKIQPAIEWNEHTGEITVDGVTVTGSHIVDICSDLSRKWRRNPPAGWDRIKMNIARGGFPQTLIINPIRRAELINIISMTSTLSNTPNIRTIPSRRTLFKTYPVRKNKRTNSRVPQSAHTQITALQNYFDTSPSIGHVSGTPPTMPTLDNAQLNVLRQIVGGTTPSPTRHVYPSLIPKPVSSRALPRRPKPAPYNTRNQINTWATHP